MPFRFECFISFLLLFFSIILNYFVNKAVFSVEDKTIRIQVDSYNEFDDMQDLIDEVEEARAAREGRTYTPSKTEDDSEEHDELLKGSQETLDQLREKYNIESIGNHGSIVPGEEFVLESPMINVLSGSYIKLNFGEGILDFIYADFVTPLKESLRFHAFIEGMGRIIQEEKIKSGEEEPKGTSPLARHSAPTYIPNEGEVKDSPKICLYHAIALLGKYA